MRMDDFLRWQLGLIDEESTWRRLHTLQELYRRHDSAYQAAFARE